ncbi:MAG TPA: FtsX-like permease family protein [Candidatus Limnocylindria bacterium]
MSLLERKLARDVGRHRWQFVAILVTVFLGVALFAASYDAYSNLQTSYDTLFERTRFAAFTAEGGDPDEVAAALRQVPGVAAVEARRVADLPFRVGDRTLVGRLVGARRDPAPAVNEVLLLSGDRPGAEEASDVLLERHMADALGLRAGDTFEVRTVTGWERLSVSGIVASPEYVWPARSRQEVFTLPDEFGVAFAAPAFLDELPEQLTTPQVSVSLEGAADDPALLATLRQRALGAGAASTFTREEQPSNATLAEDIQGFGELSLLFPLMFLTAAGLATYVLLSRMIRSQRPQIGLLLAVGFSRRRVFLHYLGFGIVTGLAGAITGAAAGVALAGAITRVYTGVIGIPITIVEIRPLTAVMGLAFGALAGALAALVPALRAARISPAAAMSGAIGSGHGSRSLAERAVPPLGRLPARWKMVLRGLGRSRVRSLSTIVGVMIAVTLVLVSWGMIDTVDVLIERQFDQAERQDATLALPAGVADADLERIAGVEGVSRAEPLLRTPVTITSDDERYATTLTAFPADTRMHGFLVDDGTRELPSDGILVGIALRDLLDLNQGDEVTLTLPQIERAVTAPVAGFVQEPLGTFAYVSRDTLAADIGSDAVDAATREVNVSLAPGTERRSVLDRLRELDGVAAVSDATALQRAAESLMGLFYAFVGVMLVLGSVMAFAVLFNLMAANIGERVTELASLRAAGMHGAELSRIITAENVLLTLAGIVPGLVVGYFGAAEFMASFSSDLFSFELEVRPTTFLLTAAGVLVAALVSQAPILRSVRRIDIATVVRERAT